MCTYPPDRPDGERCTLPATPVQWSRVSALLKYTLFSCEIFPAVGYPPKNILNDLVTSDFCFRSLRRFAEGFHLFKAFQPQLMLVISGNSRTIKQDRVKCGCKNWLRHDLIQLQGTYRNVSNKPVHYLKLFILTLFLLGDFCTVGSKPSKQLRRMPGHESKSRWKEGKIFCQMNCIRHDAVI